MKARTSILYYVMTAFTLSSCIYVIDRKKEAGLGDSDLVVSADSSQAFAKGLDSAVMDNTANHDTVKTPLGKNQIDVRLVNPQELVSFAETLKGIPYKYGSVDPKVGFDCSGFITYVFNHFGLKVPRSSVDFTHIEKEIDVTSAKRGDLILFTGTHPQDRTVGHMGIVLSNDNGKLQFIHSSSGKAYGVTVSPLEGYYQKRFVKTIRLFPQNDTLP